jgi:hypothetical protein
MALRPLPAFMDTLALAKTLRRIDPSILKPPPSGRRPHWWKGEEPYLDVFIESDEHGVAWLQVTLRGHCLTWERSTSGSSKDGTVQTGVTNELEVDAAHPASKLVRYDDAPSKELMSCVVTLLGGAPADATLAEATEIVRHASGTR